MDILAGLISGLVMGTVMLGTGIYFVTMNRDIYERLAGKLPQGISPTVVMLGSVIGIPPAWGIVGIIAGLIYHVIESSSPGDGLGSSNYVYTIAILIIAALITLVLLLFRKRIALLGLVLGVSFAGIFGWLLPVLANWR